MTKRQKLVFVMIDTLLFIGVIVFLNDRVILATSNKVAPILIALLFINSLIAPIISKERIHKF